jgi:hypothetical protein
MLFLIAAFAILTGTVVSALSYRALAIAGAASIVLWAAALANAGWSAAATVGCCVLGLVLQQAAFLAVSAWRVRTRRDDVCIRQTSRPNVN